MTERDLSTGIALICNQEGMIEDVMRDELALGDRLAPGQTLFDLADQASEEKMANFLNELQEEGAAFDWEINVAVHGRLGTLQFGGSRIDKSRFMVVAAQTGQAAQNLYAELLQITNEQTNALRAVMAAKSQLERKVGEFENVYEELTAVNNELVGLQRQLHKQNAQLLRLNQEKDRFVGMAAHDLRSPLGIIQIYADLLLTDLQANLSAEHLDILQTIHDQSGGMLSLVEDLLDITRIESGTVRLKLAQVDAVELVRRNVQRNRLLAAAKQIDLQIDYQADLPPIQADAGKIDQVLNNLISNAIKYSLPQTQVTVTVSTLDQAQASETVEPPALSIVVADQGVGIKPNELNRLFQPFGTTSNRTTGGESSTGLGLSIVKKIVESHHGHVSVESELGKGSAFHVVLPIDR